MLYGTETLAVTESDKRKIMAVEMFVLRKTCSLYTRRNSNTGCVAYYFG